MLTKSGLQHSKDSAVAMAKHVCGPFFEALDISCFVHLVIYDKGGYTGVASDIAVNNSIFLKSSIERSNASKPSCCFNERKKHLEHIVIAINKYKLLDPKNLDISAIESHNNAHLVTVLERFSQGLEVFLFHLPKCTTTADRNTFYFKNKSYLYRFILFYRVQIRKISVLKLVYSNKTRIHFLEILKQQDYAEHIEIHLRGKELFAGVKKFYMDDGSAYLTRQELRVMQHIIQSKSAKEVARIIGLSYRTVELHVAHVKKKLGSNMCIIIQSQYSSVMQFLD